MATRAVQWASGKSRRRVTATVILEEDVVDVIEETDIPIKSSDVELVEEIMTPETRGSSERRKRREYRSTGSALTNLPEIEDSVSYSPPIPMHIPPVPLPVPPGNLNRRVTCHNCNCMFEVETGLTRARCPVCGKRIELV